MSNFNDFLHKDINIEIKRKVKLKDLAIFFRQLAIMFTANIKITEVFKILLNQEKNSLTPIIKDIISKVDDGCKLSEAVSYYPKVFNNYHVSIIRTGEMTGKLSESLNFLADELEKDYDTSNKIKNALIYPVFVLITMIIVVNVITIYVIPKISTILLEGGGELPLITRILIAISNFFSRNIIFILLVIALIVFISKKYYNTEQGKIFFHKLLLKLPIFGKIFNKIYITRIAKNLFVLIKSNIPIIDSLVVLSETIGNKIYEKIIIDATDGIKNGEKISIAFSNNEYIPQMFVEMLTIGENTGELGYVLEKVSNYYTRESEDITNSLTSLIEPIIIVILGILVTFIVLSVLLPIYSLSSQI